MDAATQVKLSGDTPFVSMEVNNSGIKVDDADEEFFSCDEGEEEVFPHRLVISDNACCVTDQVEDAAEGIKVSNVTYREAWCDEKHSDCSDSVIHEYNNQCNFISIVSSSMDGIRRVSQYSVKDKTLLAGVESKSGEVRDSAIGGVGTMFTRMRSCDTSALWKSCRMTEGLGCVNEKNFENLSQMLEVKKALLSASDKASDNCDVDENGEEQIEESEDDCEYYDARSRIQSIDDGYLNIFTSPHEEHNSHVNVDTSKDISSPVEMYENHETHMNFENDTSKRIVSPFVIYENSDIPALGEVMGCEQMDFSTLCQSQEWKSDDSCDLQKVNTSCSDVVGFDETAFSDSSGYSETAVLSTVLDCSSGQLADCVSLVEKLDHNLDIKYISTGHDLECKCSFKPSHIIKQTEMDAPEFTSTACLDSVNTFSSCMLQESVLVQAGLSEAYPAVISAEQHISEILEKENAIEQLVCETFPTVSVIERCVSETLPTVNATNQHVSTPLISEMLPTVNTAEQLPASEMLSMPLASCSENITPLSELSPTAQSTPSPISPLKVKNLNDVEPLLNVTEQSIGNSESLPNALKHPSKIRRKAKYSGGPKSDVAKTHTAKTLDRASRKGKLIVGTTRPRVTKSRNSLSADEAAQSGGALELSERDVPLSGVANVPLNADTAVSSFCLERETEVSLVDSQAVTLSENLLHLSLSTNWNHVNCRRTSSSASSPLNVFEETCSERVDPENTSESSHSLCESSGKEILPHKSTQSSGKEILPQKSTQSSGKEILPQKSTQSSGKNILPHKSTQSSGKEILPHKSTQSSGEEILHHKSTQSSGKEILHHKSTQSSGKEIVPDNSTQSSGKEILHHNYTESSGDKILSHISTESSGDKILPHKSTESSGDKILPHKSTESSGDKILPHKSTESSGDKILPHISTECPAEEILPHNSPEIQHSCDMLQSTETCMLSDISHHFVQSNSEHNNINTSDEILNEIDDNYNKIDNEEDSDRVSEDSLGEATGNTPGINTYWDDVAGEDLCDSLDEECDVISVGSHEDRLTELEEKPKQIDRNQAKLRSSLSWLLSKVYGSNVPRELQDPFYETAEGQLVLRPVMVNLMSSSELYCQACKNLFPETHTQWKGHWSIIQVLSRKGIYISEVHESAVTETVLVQTAPFRLKAHLALIDALMKAYTCEVASVEKVVRAVRRITTFPASSELPDTPEEALIFWINKVCIVFGTEGASEGRSEEVMEGTTGQKVRVSGKASSHHEAVQVPLLVDLMRDIGDGCSVAAVLAYYRPQLINLKDLCLKEGIGIADTLHNLCQIGQFCQNHIPWKCFHFSYEDFLYTHDVMKVNFTAFLADLFFYFEGPNSCETKNDGFGSAKTSSERVDALPAAGKKSSQSVHPHVAVSKATKRSFNKQGFEETANNLGMWSLHQPVLSKRIAGRHCIPQEEGGVSSSASTKRRTGRRAMSLCTPQDRDVVQKSVLAWQDDQRIQQRPDQHGSGTRSHGRLMANTSIDSVLNQNFNNNNSLSLDLSGLETSDFNSRSPLDSSHLDYMELESITSSRSPVTSPQQQSADHFGRRTPSAVANDHWLEPLMPALLKPTKEKETNLSKAEERGDRLLRRKRITSPLEPHSPTTPQMQRPSPQLSQQQLHDMTLSARSDITPVLSLPPDASTAGSYTLKDRASSAQAARAAGIPVVSDSDDMTLTTDRFREGSITSSGEYSDHESQKIHQEYKVRESGLTTPPDLEVISTNISNNNSKPVMLISDHLSKTAPKYGGGDDSSVLNKLSLNTTNFAELKRLKDNLGYNLDKVDRSVLIYMQSGSHGGPYDKTSGVDIKSNIVLKQGQTRQHNKDDSDNATLEASEANPGAVEMQQLRLKLEQKRKDIERKKHRQEAQHNKMRQQLGKAAFMRVVSKHADGGVEDESPDQIDSSRSENMPNSSQAQLQARLGHPAQRLPLGSSSKSPQPSHSNPLQSAFDQGSPNSVIPADASAQRFTDWRSQSQFSRGAGGSLSALAAANNQSKHLDQKQQLLQMHTGAIGGNDDYSSVSSQTSGNKAFSREGIQQTIDTVKNKWFKNDSNLITGEAVCSDEEDTDGATFRLHDDDLLAGVRAKNMQEHSRTPSRSHSHSPLQGALQFLPAQYVNVTAPVLTQETASPPHSVSGLEYQVYDSSLNKLNSSLTELQGEIMRLSLQHEQLKAAQSPVGSQADRFSPKINDGLTTIGPAVGGVSSVQTRPIHGIPQQGLHMQGVMARQSIPISSSQQQLPPTTCGPQQKDADISYLQQAVSDIFSASGSTPDQTRQNISESDDAASFNTDGFFVSFGENTTPKRPKPKKTENRTRGVSPAPTSGQAGTPPTAKVPSDAAGPSNDIAATLAGQAIVANLTPQKTDEPDDESSPSVGFVIKDETAIVKETVAEDEMQKKRIKLIEMQRKRKEDQEKKRLEKEAEIAKKQEEKQLKEEEQERKKAEEKARRETIFQQYLQKKQEDEEGSPVKPQPKRRDASANKQRPKSMFVKSKAMTPEPGALATDSGSSSQEDLTGRANMSGRSTPSVMSALRSSFHFRLPPPSQIRKAVSCNTLQGTTNGAQGPSTYRRPPSPDLARLKQQRQRGNSQDGGSETGASSFPGADYAGPKLFVKPSAKSNRHIIVNAISHCCLAGSVNTDMKNKVLEEMSKCEANHFLILFRDGGCQFRGLFILYPETEEAFKLLGVGPKHITSAMCEKFYKYNSGAKSFSEITSTKHLSVSIDAVVLHTAVWKSGRAAIKR